MSAPATYEQLQAGYEHMRELCREAQDGWTAERRKLWATETALRDLVALLANTGFHNSIEMAAARKLLATPSVEAEIARLAPAPDRLQGEDVGV